MGADTSIPIRQPPPGFEYLVISLSSVDRIRVLFGTQSELSIIRQAVSDHWSQGLQLEKLKCGYSVTFKLSGFPFRVRGASSTQAASVRLLVSQILRRINNAGWELQIASDLSQLGDLSTFFFINKSVQHVKQIQYPLLCIGFSSTDKLQIVNAPANIIGAIKSIVQASWGPGIQSEGRNGNCYEFKLLGNPWWATGYESVQARILLNKLLTTLAQHQLVLHCAANIKSTADSLFFKYDPTAVPGQVSPHFVISLNRTDRLRMINAPEAVVQIVREIIKQYWSTRGGIQGERIYNGSWEFKLSGNPWWSTGEESVMTRFLMCKILEGLQSAGWHIKSAIDICRRLQDKSVLVFYQAQPLNAPVMCLSLNDMDKIRLVNTPEEFIGILRGLIQTYWLKGMQEDTRLQSQCMAHQFKLAGHPWLGYTRANDGLHSRSLLCYFHQAISQRGWRLLTSADVSAKFVKQKNGPGRSIDVHSWWFSYDTSVLQPTAPATYGFTPTQFTASANTGVGMGQTSDPSIPPPSYEQALSGQAPK